MLYTLYIVYSPFYLLFRNQSEDFRSKSFVMSSFVYVDEERAIQPLSKEKLQRVGYLECLHVNSNVFLFVFYALIY